MALKVVGRVGAVREGEFLGSHSSARKHGLSALYPILAPTHEPQTQNQYRRLHTYVLSSSPDLKAAASSVMVLYLGLLIGMV